MQPYPSQPPMHPGQPYPPPQKSGGSTIWIILAVVLGGIVVMVGVLGVLAMFGVRKYIANAKTAEALNGVSAIARDAEAAFEENNAHGPEGLCSSASKPVPSSATMIAGKKYQSSPTEWTVDQAKNGGFSCVAFSMETPQYFQYDYQRTGSATGAAVGDGFHAIAHGDLDGNGVVSTFDLSGKIVAEEKLQLASTVDQINPGE